MTDVPDQPRRKRGRPRLDDPEGSSRPPQKQSNSDAAADRIVAAIEKQTEAIAALTAVIAKVLEDRREIPDLVPDETPVPARSFLRPFASPSSRRAVAVPRPSPDLRDLFGWRPVVGTNGRLVFTLPMMLPPDGRIRQAARLCVTEGVGFVISLSNAPPCWVRSRDAPQGLPRVMPRMRWEVHPETMPASRLYDLAVSVISHMRRHVVVVAAWERKGCGIIGACVLALLGLDPEAAERWSVASDPAGSRPSADVLRTLQTRSKHAATASATAAWGRALVK